MKYDCHDRILEENSNFLEIKYVYILIQIHIDILSKSVLKGNFTAEG